MDNLPNKPTSPAFQPLTASDLGGKPSSLGTQPVVPSKPYTPPEPSTPPTKPSTPPLSPPVPPAPPAAPPIEKPGIPMQKPTDKGDSRKAKIVGAVLGLLLLVVALPVAVYLVKQRQYIWPGAVYPSPSPSVPPDDCQAQLQTEAEDRELCDTEADEAKVYVWATRSQGAGCPESSASYTYKKSSCCGDEYATEDCSPACSEHQQTLSGTVTIPAGQTSSGRNTVSCRIPDDCGNECAACQVDVVGGWGQMAWKCPEVSPSPSPSPSPSVPPEYQATCEDCLIYDEDFGEITDLLTLKVGQKIILGTLGSTDHPEGITKARFRISVDDEVGSWQEGTEKFTTSEGKSLFYIEYTIPSAGFYWIESMVYNSVLGWK